jgi:hypothetical protein
MNFKKLGFTPCGIKNISRILLLSFTCSVLLDSAALNGARSKVATKAKSSLQLSASGLTYSAALAAATTQRQVWLSKVSGPLNSTILATGNPFAIVPFWTPIWSGLQTKITNNKNLIPGDVVGSASNKFLPGYTFSAIYNDFYYKTAAGQAPGGATLAQIIGDDAKQSMLAALLYFGANVTSDQTEAAWYPTTQPLLSFYAPGGTTSPTGAIPSPYFAGSTASNLESPGGILIKNSTFCTALNSTYGAGAWSGATCINDQDCCTDANGNQQACLINADTAKLVPAFEDPVSSTQVTYGMCVTPVASCGQALNASCPSVGTAAGQAGCCVGSSLQCVGTGASALCKSGTGGSCQLATDCANSGNTCVNGTCQAPQTCKLFGLNTGCVSGSATNDCCKKDASGNPISLTCSSGNCLGAIGYACSTNQDCATGLECPAGGGQCMQTPTTCPVANLANNATCSQAVGAACCTNYNAGVNCAAGQGATVAAASPGLACCINPDNGTAISRDAPCFVQTGATAGYSTDCCSGFTCLDTSNTPVTANASGVAAASGTCGNYTAPTVDNPNPTPTPPVKGMSPWEDSVIVIAALAGIKGFDMIMVKVTKNGTDNMNKYTDWYFVKATPGQAGRQTKVAYVAEKATGIMKFLSSHVVDSPIGQFVMEKAGLDAETITQIRGSWAALQKAGANAQAVVDGLGLTVALNPNVAAATQAADADEATGGHPYAPPTGIIVPNLNVATNELYNTLTNQLKDAQSPATGRTFEAFAAMDSLKGDLVNAMTLAEIMTLDNAVGKDSNAVDYDVLTRQVANNSNITVEDKGAKTYTQADYYKYAAAGLTVDTSELPISFKAYYTNTANVPQYIQERCIAYATARGMTMVNAEFFVFRALYKNGLSQWKTVDGDGATENFKPVVQPFEF